MRTIDSAVPIKKVRAKANSNLGLTQKKSHQCKKETNHIHDKKSQA